MYVLHHDKMLLEGISHCRRAVIGKKCTKSVICTCKVAVLLCFSDVFVSVIVVIANGP